MGLANAPDIFQAAMARCLDGLDHARAHVNNALVTSNGSHEDHLKKVEEVTKRLHDFGFRINLKKSHFAADNAEHLGHLISTKGIQPQPKKVEAINRLLPPKTKRQLRHFLGMISFCRDTWKQRSHVLAPLSATTGKNTKLDWTQECQEPFEELKRIMA